MQSLNLCPAWPIQMLKSCGKVVLPQPSSRWTLNMAYATRNHAYQVFLGCKIMQSRVFCLLGQKWCYKISLWRWAAPRRGIEKDFPVWSGNFPIILTENYLHSSESTTPSLSLAPPSSTCIRPKNPNMNNENEKVERFWLLGWKGRKRT